MTDTTRDAIKAALDRRFGDAPDVPSALQGEEALLRMAAHRTHRAFADKPRRARAICSSATSCWSRTRRSAGSSTR
jgi:hypothetical protein